MAITLAIVTMIAALTTTAALFTITTTLAAVRRHDDDSKTVADSLQGSSIKIGTMQRIE